MRLLFRMFLVFLTACAPGTSDKQVSAQGLLTLEQFTDEVIRELRATGEIECVNRIDGGGFHYGATSGDCETFTMFTDNTYNAYKAEPERKDALISRLVNVSVEALLSADGIGSLPDDYQDRLVVVLRPTDYGAPVPDSPPIGLVMRPIAGDMAAMLAVDSADSLMPLLPDMVEESGKPEDELFALAYENTRQRMGRVEREKDGDLEYVYAATGLATGILALPKSCTAKTKPYYAVVLDRDTFVRSSEVAKAGVGALARFVLDHRGQNTSFSETLMYCHNGEWSAADAAALAD